MRLRILFTTHALYLWSLFFKGLDGILEIVGGVLLFFLRPDQIHNLIRLLTQHELSEDSQDIVANHLLNTSKELSLSAQHFGAWYLLSHGVIKIFIITSLLKKKYWAYPTAIIFFILFIFYQIYRYTFTESVYLILLTVFDLIVIWLIIIEYKLIRKTRNEDDVN